MISREDPEEPKNLSRNPKSIEVVEASVASQPGKKKMIASERPLLLVILKSSPIVILAISCVIAVFVDPLFFYLPIIDEKNKCIGMDTNLRNVVLILRSLTDMGFVVHIIHKFREAVGKTKHDLQLQLHKFREALGETRHDLHLHNLRLARNLSWHSIVIDFFAVLPIPQVVIVAVRSSRYLHQRKISNFFLLAQYLPRIYRMRHSYVKFSQKISMWVKSSFLFFLYVLAGHVLGAFWYYFSIQQEISCWHQACENNNIGACNFYCNENMASRNTTFIDTLDQFCLVDIPTNEMTSFDFGIFLDSLKHGNSGSIHFADKFFYSFWWGLRNLSNFGTSLETSTYVWENCFAIFTSILGLLLFLYLIGQVQTFISMKTEKLAEESGEKWKERMNWLELKTLNIHMWMERNGLHKELRRDIIENINKKWEYVQDVDLENIYNILPLHSRNSVKNYLCVDRLKKDPKLKNLNSVRLTLVCAYLKPVVYQDRSLIFQIGEPLDRILIITEGLVWTYEAAATSNSNSCTSQDGIEETSFRSLQNGDSYGVDQLLSWAFPSHTPMDDSSFGNLPISNKNVKCHGKVEGFVLMAKDLKTVVSKSREVAAQTIQMAFRRFKYRQRVRSLSGGRSNKTSIFSLLPTLRDLSLCPECFRPGLSINAYP